MNEIRQHPLWHEVVELIVSDVSEKGHGSFYSHAELKDLLDIKEPKTIEEYKKSEFEYMNAMEPLREELLLEHNIYLSNKRGEGYVILKPDDQVKDGPEKTLARARALTVKAHNILLCVEEALLSEEMKKTRLNKITKTAFLRAAFRKRKFPAIEGPPEKKQIA